METGMARWGFGLLLWACTFTAWARPVDLSPPGNGLGSASPEGYVSFYIDVATADFGNGLQLPLRVDFNSGSKSVSPYVGAHARCVLLEAIAVQTREGAFDVGLLCGKHLYLYRSKKDPTQYWDRNHEWQGELKGNVLRVFRDDKWELAYMNGRIATLRTDSGRILNWQWRDNVVTAITEGGRGGVFEVRFDPTSKLVTAFLVNGKAYGLELTQPQELVSVPSLTKLTWPDGRSESFALDTARNELTTKDREGTENRYTWHDKTRHIISDGEWTYQVGEVKSRYERPPLSRRNKAGEMQAYSYEAAKGISTSQASDGTITRQYFVKSAGPNYMAVRKVERVEKGKTTTTYRASFNEAGKLLREIDGNGKITIYGYDAANNQVSAIQDGKPLWKKEYNSTGQLVSEVRENNERVSYRYPRKGVVEKTLTPVGGEAYTDLVEDTELKQRTFQGGKTYRYAYYKENGAMKEMVAPDGMRWEYKYDPSTGKVNEVKKDGHIWWRVIFEQEKKRDLTVYYRVDGAVSAVVETATRIPLDAEELKNLIASQIIPSSK
jgi:YD repeat-containing protein